MAVDAEPTQREPVVGLTGGSVLGKRYTDEAGSVELLVTKSGTGSLGIGFATLVPKTAKPLLASD